MGVGMKIDQRSPRQIMDDTREHQRGIIMRSMIYTSGAGFSVNDAARVLRADRSIAGHVLESMCKDGLVSKNIALNKKITYNSKTVDWLRKSWRTVSNCELEIFPNRLGQY